MKALVFVLALANLLFFAYTQGYFGHPENPDAGRVQQQLNADRIRVIARSEPPSAKNAGKKETALAEKEETASEEAAPVQKPAAPPDKAPVVPEKPPAAPEKPTLPVAEKAPPESCVTWNDVPPADANRLASLIGEKFTDYRVERRAVLPADGSSWWVFIPPQPSKADAERKTGELKRMGINDFFIIQEPGPNRFAISLGVFSSEAGAGDHLANLKSKGVRSAKAAPRAGKDAHQVIEARGPAPRRAALLAAAAAAAPETAGQACR